jgi:hypothetical protein
MVLLRDFFVSDVGFLLIMFLLAGAFILISAWWYTVATNANGGIPLSPHVMCPHCQTKGQMLLERAAVKQGISGAKMTGALLTGGASILATALYGTQWVQKATCLNCQTAWSIV